MVRLRGSLDGFHGDFHIAVRAILEADRTGQSRRQLAVHLRLRGARADGAPADQVGDVLRADDVEEFGAGRQAQLIDIAQQFARHAQAVIDAEAIVHVRVVDQALPADRGARLLEVDAHDDFQFTGKTRALLDQQARIFHGRLGIVDGARPDHHHQAVVLAVQDTVQGNAGAGSGLFGLLRAGEFADQVGRRGQFLHFANSQIIGAGHHFLQNLRKGKTSG